jgi:hypothetical protein
MRASDASRFTQLATRHAHPHGVSRRQLLQAGAATGAVMAASSFFAPLVAAEDDEAHGGGKPVPVPPNPNFFNLHLYFVGVGMESSTITDFKGAVGAAVVDGTGMNPSTGESLNFDTDMRFMQGVFRGKDGHSHEGTFAFI